MSWACLPAQPPPLHSTPPPSHSTHTPIPGGSLNYFQFPELTLLFESTFLGLYSYCSFCLE